MKWLIRKFDEWFLGSIRIDRLDYCDMRSLLQLIRAHYLGWSLRGKFKDIEYTPLREMKNDTN